MPKTERKQQRTVYTALPQNDYAKFTNLAQKKQITNSELLRAAFFFYLEHQERLEMEERDSKLEKRLKRMEDRMAGLLARTAIDVGVIYNILWRNMPEKEKEKAFKTAYKQSVERIKQKISEQDKDISDLVK